MLRMGGYGGKILKINLSAETAVEYPWDEGQRERYLGGKILAAQILLEHLSGRETALSEENPLIFATGPLTGSLAPGSARFDIAALSPKDDRPAFSNCGGSFGIWLKKAGYDAVILTGRCKEKRWLELGEDGVRFHDAACIWGSTVSRCRKKLEEALNRERMGTISIGPAGENLVTFASMMADGHSTGRAGLGAVMGWKNLKAIAVFGEKEIPLHAPEAVAAFNAHWHTLLKQQGEKQEGMQEGTSCTGCPLHCSRHKQEGSELLNELGMDAIAARDALLWAQEQGYPTQALYEQIAYRRGIGDILAAGVHRGKGKGGNRRGGSYRAIAEAFGMTLDTMETERFCRCLTEAISAAGQCMFTVSGLAGQPEKPPAIPAAQMLTLVTGRKTGLEQLLALGESSLALEQQLKQIYSKNDR